MPTQLAATACVCTVRVRRLCVALCVVVGEGVACSPVKHILIECPALISSRNKHFTASSMKDLFDNVPARNIINFIKESHFYSAV